jgi:hypothetical protein
VFECERPAGLAGKGPSEGSAIRPTGLVTWAIHPGVVVEWTAREFAGANSDSSHRPSRKPTQAPRGLGWLYARQDSNL